MNQEILKDSDLEPQGKRLLLISPLDWAIAFSTGNFAKVLTYLVPVIAIELALVAYRFSAPLSTSAIFIIGALESFLSVWFITVLVFLGIAIFRREEIAPLRLALTAVSHLPKVFFSYLLVVMVVGVSLLSLQAMMMAKDIPSLLVLIFALPLLFVSAYLLWAPLYCAAEGMTLQDPKENDDEEIDPDDDEAIEEAIAARLKLEFKRKMPWELGFSRSVRLSSFNVVLTYTLVLFIATASFLPAAILTTFFGPGLVRSALEVVLVNCSQAYALFIGIGAFLLVLPKDAKVELGIKQFLDPREFFGSVTVPRNIFHGKRQSYLFTIIVCALSFLVVVQSTLKSQQVPSTLTHTIDQVEISKGGFLVLTVTLTDAEQYFQWFRAEGFVLKTVVAGAAADAAPTEIESSEVEILGADGMPSTELLVPPRFQPITVRLFFKLPKEELEKQFTWQLMFSEITGTEAEITKGEQAGQAA